MGPWLSILHTHSLCLPSNLLDVVMLFNSSCPALSGQSLLLIFVVVDQRMFRVCTKQCGQTRDCSRDQTLLVSSVLGPRVARAESTKVPTPSSLPVASTSRHNDSSAATVTTTRHPLTPGDHGRCRPSSTIPQTSTSHSKHSLTTTTTMAI